MDLTQMADMKALADMQARTLALQLACQTSRDGIADSILDAAGKFQAFMTGATAPNSDS